MVEACFAHVGVLGKRFGEPDLDWRKIEKDLLAVRGNEACDGSFSYCGWGDPDTCDERQAWIVEFWIIMAWIIFISQIMYIFAICIKHLPGGHIMNTVILSDGTSYYIPNSDLSFFKELALRSNYSAPIEVSPIGMSDHLTVLQQQELHCISNFRSS